MKICRKGRRCRKAASLYKTPSLYSFLPFLHLLPFLRYTLHMIDSHCHLTAEQFNEDRDDVIKRALTAGVTTMVCIGDTFKSTEAAQQLSNKYPQVYFTAGIHPHHAEQWNNDSVNILTQYASDPRCKAIGEIGLDYFYMNQPKNVQNNACKAQMLLAQQLGLPIVLHCREAISELSSLK